MIAATIRPGDRLGNAYPRHLMEPITGYRVLRTDNAEGTLDLEAGFLGTSRWTRQQIDWRIASGELSVERKIQ